MRSCSPLSSRLLGARSPVHIAFEHLFSIVLPITILFCSVFLLVPVVVVCFSLLAMFEATLRALFVLNLLEFLSRHSGKYCPPTFPNKLLFLTISAVYVSCGRILRTLLVKMSFVSIYRRSVVFARSSFFSTMGIFFSVVFQSHVSISIMISISCPCQFSSPPHIFAILTLFA